MSMKNKYKSCFIAMLLGLPGILFINEPAEASPFERSHRSFMKKDQDYKRLMGITAGIGSIETEESEQGASAYFNMFMFWFNFSVEYQSFDSYSNTNTYTGVGMGRYFQLQYGYGDEGYLMRIRSEIEVVGRMTVFVARERYRENPQFDNYSAGIGYRF